MSASALCVLAWRLLSAQYSEDGEIVALDLTNPDGELDRGKVNAEVRRLLDLALEVGDPHAAEQGIISLIDEAVDAAYQDGVSDMQDQA